MPRPRKVRCPHALQCTIKACGHRKLHRRGPQRVADICRKAGKTPRTNAKCVVPRKTKKKKRQFIVRVDAYHGEDTWLQIGCQPNGGHIGQEHMYVLVTVTSGGAHITDYGYETAEALKAVCPEAVMPKEG